MSVLVLAEQRGGMIHPTTYELLARARALADKLGAAVNCAVIGCNPGEQAREMIGRGADRVFVANEPRDVAWSLPGPCSRALERVIELVEPEVVLAAATTTGRTVMPMVAARLRTGLTADCTELDIDVAERLLLQTRPAIGGKIMATIKTPRPDHRWPRCARSPAGRCLVTIPAGAWWSRSALHSLTWT